MKIILLLACLCWSATHIICGDIKMNDEYQEGYISFTFLENFKVLRMQEYPVAKDGYEDIKIARYAVFEGRETWWGRLGNKEVVFIIDMKHLWVSLSGPGVYVKCTFHHTEDD